MRFAILHRRTAERTGDIELASTTRVTVQAHLPLPPSTMASRIACASNGPHAPTRIAADADPKLAALDIIEADSREAAIDWLRDHAASNAGTEFELRETGCPGGLPGVDPSLKASKPRFLIVVKADAQTEVDHVPPAERLERMARCNDDAIRSGMLLAADGLQSTAKATRVGQRGGKTSVIDGPFAETKELVAGFWLVQAASIEEAKAWVRAYPYAQDNPEVLVYPVA